MKQIVILPLLVAVVGLGAAASHKGQYRNLKVLPKDISSKDLQGVMTDDFEDGLGISCGFCHAANKNGRGLDFASDAKPEKEIARKMMRMTLDLNKEYFKVHKPRIGNNTLTITCATCHKGEPFPDGDVLH
ncbi:MAG TPA: c-type cytochrome [Puia sp.]|nr:c-type cytochrome [Puia sp.]